MASTFDRLLAQYRAKAEECRREASVATAEAVRAQLLHDAELWERMASYEESQRGDSAPSGPPLAFDLAQVLRLSDRLINYMARPFLYCCPTTGQNVQGLIERDPPSDDSQQYDAIECAACRSFHFVNVATLKLLSDEIED